MYLLSPPYSVYVSYCRETNQATEYSSFLKVGKCQRRLNLWANATLSRLPRHLLLKLMSMIQCTDQASHFSLSYQMDSAFPSLSDFNVTALKWTDLNQITSTRTVHTQHGQSVILSKKPIDQAVLLGMLSNELLQNPMKMVSS